MKAEFLAVILTLFLLIPGASALESGTVFSAEPGEGYRCIYLSLPQDLGLDYIETTSEATIRLDRSESPWADITYNRVVMTPGVLKRNPICFHYSDAEEGDFSFFRIMLSSEDLGVSSSISGGMCISSYQDVDTGVEVTNETDICRLLNENADIIDVSFKEDVTIAKPGETVTKTVYVTSYANLRVKLYIATNLENNFREEVLVTSPSNPTAFKRFAVKAPEREGDFDIIMRAEAENCGVKACRKQRKTTLSVSEEEREYVSASVVPKNINLKEPGEAVFRVIISNHDETQNFLVEADTSPEIGITPASKSVNIESGEEETIIFNAVPEDPGLYEVNFRINSDKTEKLLTSYVSIGELLSDAERRSEQIKRTEPSVRSDVQQVVEAYEESYTDISYEESVEEYEEFTESLDQLERAPESGGETGETTQDSVETGFNWAFLAIPVIVAVVVILLLFAYKRSKVTDPIDYRGYGGRY